MDWRRFLIHIMQIDQDGVEDIDEYNAFDAV